MGGKQCLSYNPDIDKRSCSAFNIDIVCVLNLSGLLCVSPPVKFFFPVLQSMKTVVCHHG